MLDLLFKNALIADGSGAPSYIGDVGVQQGKIVKIRPQIEDEAGRLIDCTDRILCPGFIDSHSHSDLVILDNPICDLKLRQGVTTEICGQCGLTIAPVSSDHFEERNQHSLVTVFFQGRRQPYISTEKLFSHLEQTALGTNHLCFVGQGTVRETVMGYADQPADSRQLEEMKSLVREAMEAGAMGLSSGLAYSPGNFTPNSEIIELCKVVAEYNGIYTSHMRNQAHGMLQCVADTIEVARQTGCRACISHIKSIGRSNWGNMKYALALIEEARAQGLDVWCDAYPYDAGATTLTVTLPPSLMEGGTDRLVERLHKPETLQYIREQFNNPTERWENAAGENGMESFLIIDAPATPEAVGKRISEYAGDLGIDPFAAYVKLLIDNNASVSTVNFVMDEADLITAISSSLCLIGSDGTCNPGAVITHPRAIGTFPRYLGRYARDKQLFSLEQAVAKITGATADRYALTHKGYVKEGYDADLVVFDWDHIADTADFINCFGENRGIDYVVVNGVIAVAHNQCSGHLSGKLLRRPNKQQ